MDKLHVVYGYTRLAIQRHLNGCQAATDDIPSPLALLLCLELPAGPFRSPSVL